MNTPSTPAWTSRLTKSGYSRPDKTYTDMLTKDQILDKLDGYKQVDDLFKVPLGSHIRYFKKLPNGKDKFCMGGFLHKNDGLPKYVILNNGKNSWSVQVKDTKFFRKLSNKEVVDAYETKLEELEEKNKSLRTYIKKIKEERDYYKKKCGE